MSHASSVPRCDAPDGPCHVCGDVAVTGRVIAIDRVGRTAVVAMGEEQATVALDLVDAELGDDLLVHLGFAIERLERA